MSRPLLPKWARAFLTRAGRDETGVTAVEFALVAPVFLGLILATLQIFVVWLAKTELQMATEYGARQVLTSQAATTASAATFQTAVCSQLPIIMQCGNVLISLTPQTSLATVSTAVPTLTYDANGNVTNKMNYNTGGASSIMVLQVFYQLPVIAGPLFNFATQSNGDLLLVSTLVFQNEPQ